VSEALGAGQKRAQLLGLTIIKKKLGREDLKIYRKIVA
jgi:hypothetical protein